ncbi:MAG: hypothetical protein MZV63_61885 [Marinilabiliales bacterium]|nr:hypothetical protein [Marinilabiliales bacterium]
MTAATSGYNPSNPTIPVRRSGYTATGGRSSAQAMPGTVRSATAPDRHSELI